MKSWKTLGSELRQVLQHLCEKALGLLLLSSDMLWSSFQALLPPCRRSRFLHVSVHFLCLHALVSNFVSAVIFLYSVLFSGDGSFS